LFRPGTFIPDRACSAFVSDLEELAGASGTEPVGDPGGPDAGPGAGGTEPYPG